MLFEQELAIKVQSELHQIDRYHERVNRQEWERTTISWTPDKSEETQVYLSFDRLDLQEAVKDPINHIADAYAWHGFEEISFVDLHTMPENALIIWNPESYLFTEGLFYFRRDSELTVKVWNMPWGSMFIPIDEFGKSAYIAPIDDIVAEDNTTRDVDNLDIYHGVLIQYPNENTTIDPAYRMPNFNWRTYKNRNQLRDLRPIVDEPRFRFQRYNLNSNDESYLGVKFL